MWYVIFPLRLVREKKANMIRDSRVLSRICIQENLNKKRRFEGELELYYVRTSGRVIIVTFRGKEKISFLFLFSLYWF